MPTNIVIAIDDPSNIDGWGLRPIGGAGFLDLCISIGSPLTAARKTEILAGTLPQ